MISKELLSEVLNQIIESVHKPKDSNKINYTVSFGGYWSINIYELAHMCKEWAEKQTHYEFVVYAGDVYLTDQGLGGEGGFYCEELFEADTEPEAIFKACQWILDNKEI